MYLLKQIYIEVNSVINQLIVILVLTTSAYLFSSAYAGTNAESPALLRVEITAQNGHVNTNNNTRQTQPSHKSVTYYNTGRCGRYKKQLFIKCL